jgi:hypothetical protein
MGSIMSGRHRTTKRGSIDSKLRLDLRVLRTLGFLVPGAVASGQVSWTRRGEPSGSIRLSVDLRDRNNLFAVLEFSVNGEPKVQRVALEAAPCGFGGQRYFFRCPTSGRRCLVLAAVDGVFACRQAHRLAYSSQSENELDRLIRARETAKDRVEGRNGHPMPTGVNRLRLLRRWHELEDRVDVLFESESVRRFGVSLDSALAELNAAQA